jgi:predicted DNA-binding transcriptional regulator AlpA
MSTLQPWVDCPPTGRLVRSAEAAKFLGLSRSRFYQMVAEGSLPRPFKVSPDADSRVVALPLSWLESVVAARAAASLETAS